MTTERLYLHNKLVYEGDDGFRGSQNPSLNRLHEALFCPVCGEIWARWLRGGDYWNIVTRGCILHEDGRIFESRHCDSATIFTGALLQREFMRQTSFIPSLLEERKRK